MVRHSILNRRNSLGRMFRRLQVKDHQLEAKLLPAILLINMARPKLNALFILLLVCNSCNPKQETPLVEETARSRSEVVNVFATTPWRHHWTGNVKDFRRGRIRIRSRSEYDTVRMTFSFSSGSMNQDFSTEVYTLPDSTSEIDIILGRPLFLSVDVIVDHDTLQFYGFSSGTEFFVKSSRKYLEGKMVRTHTIIPMGIEFDFTL